MKMNRRLTAVLLKLIGIGIFLITALALTGTANAESDPVRKAIISQAKGKVEVRIGEKPWQPAKVGMVLHENDQIRTGGGSSAKTLLDDKGSTGKLDVKENTLVRFNKMNWDEASKDKTTLIDVAMGKVKVHAEKLRGKSKFEINTPTAVLGIRGTTFEVNVWESAKAASKTDQK